MIAYKLTLGIAHDIRFVPEDYIPQAGEFTVDGGIDVLPSQETLSDPDAWQAKLTLEAAKKSRQDAIDANLNSISIGTTQPATLAELRQMTLAEYNTWFDANFDTAAKLISLLKRIMLLLIRG